MELYFKTDERVNLTLKKYRKVKGIKNSTNPRKSSTLHQDGEEINETQSQLINSRLLQFQILSVKIDETVRENFQVALKFHVHLSTVLL